MLDKVQIFEIRDEFREFIDLIEDSVFTLNGVTYTIGATEMREVYLRQQHLIFCDTFLSNLPTHNKQILQDEKARSHVWNEAIAEILRRLERFIVFD